MIGMAVVSSTRGVLTKQVEAVPEDGATGRQIAAWHIDREGEVLSVVVTFDGEGMAPDRAPALALADADTDQLLAELRSRMESDRYDYDDPSEYDD